MGVHKCGHVILIPRLNIKRYSIFLLLCILLGTLFFDALLVAAQSNSAHAQSDSLKDSSDSVNPSGQSKFMFKFYRDYISSADGDRCPMSPSCSAYGEQAIRKHGIFMGWIMTCDRLIRCGRDEVHLSETVESGAKRLTLDPVEANDFWWYPSISSKRYPHGSSN